MFFFKKKTLLFMYCMFVQYYLHVFYDKYLPAMKIIFHMT